MIKAWIEVDDGRETPHGIGVVFPDGATDAEVRDGLSTATEAVLKHVRSLLSCNPALSPVSAAVEGAAA